MNRRDFLKRVGAAVTGSTAIAQSGLSVDGLDLANGPDSTIWVAHKGIHDELEMVGEFREIEGQVYQLMRHTLSEELQSGYEYSWRQVLNLDQYNYYRGNDGDS